MDFNYKAEKSTAGNIAQKVDNQSTAFLPKEFNARPVPGQFESQKPSVPISPSVNPSSPPEPHSFNPPLDVQSFARIQEFQDKIHAKIPKMPPVPGQPKPLNPSIPMVPGMNPNKTPKPLESYSTIVTGANVSLPYEAQTSISHSNPGTPSNQKTTNYKKKSKKCSTNKLNTKTENELREMVPESHLAKLEQLLENNRDSDGMVSNNVLHNLKMWILQLLDEEIKGSFEQANKKDAKPITLFRNTEMENYTKLDQQIFENDQFDHRHMIILAYLLKNCDHWIIRKEYTRVKLKMKQKPFNTAWEDLKKWGYIRLIRKQKGWIIFCYENPKHNPHSPSYEATFT